MVLRPWFFWLLEEITNGQLWSWRYKWAVWRFKLAFLRPHPLHCTAASTHGFHVTALGVSCRVVASPLPRSAGKAMGSPFLAEQSTEGRGELA